MHMTMMSLESNPCATSVIQLIIGFRHYRITRPDQNHQSLQSSLGKTNGVIFKAKVIRSVAIPNPRPLWFLIFVDTAHLAWRVCDTKACLNTDRVYAPARYGPSRDVYSRSRVRRRPCAKNCTTDSRPRWPPPWLDACSQPLLALNRFSTTSHR